MWYAFAETEVAKLDLPASVRVLGDNAFERVDAINIRSNSLPYNLMRAVSPANWNGYWKYDSYDIPMTVEISVNGRVIYLPKFIINFKPGNPMPLGAGRKGSFFTKKMKNLLFFYSLLKNPAY